MSARKQECSTMSGSSRGSSVLVKQFSSLHPLALEVGSFSRPMKVLLDREWFFGVNGEVPHSGWPAYSHFLVRWVSCSESLLDTENWFVQKGE